MSEGSRTFSYRALVIGIAAMLVMGLWVHFHEVLVPHPNILAENSPPASAVGIIIGILLVAGLLARFRRSLRLEKGELLVIYSMLVISAPLMSQGMWHRFIGLIISIPHNPENMVLADSFSEKLWPHGPHLVENRRFEAGLDERAAAQPKEKVKVVPAPQTQVGATSAVELQGTEASETTFRIQVPRRQHGSEVLVPGERYFLSGLFKLTGFRSQSRLSVELVSGEERVQVLTLGRDTPETYSRPGGFQRAGQPYLSLPRTLGEQLDLVFTLSGAGTAQVTDVTFFSNESLARLHKGTSEIRESDLPRLPADSRESLLVRPDNLASPSGIWYALKGSIPYREWLTPMLYWGSIVLALFLGLLGIGVIFRKQWAEHERFSFPLVVVPRLLLEEREENGRTVRPLFRSGTFLVGMSLAILYCMLQGLAFYVPGLPDPTVQLNLTEYVGSPAMKAFVAGFDPGGAGGFQIVLLFTAIAFFVELDMLLSIVVCFWLAKLPFYFGEALGWKNLKGPVDAFPFAQEQHIGAFLSLALIVLWTARRHLLAVGRRAFGLAGGADDTSEAFSYRTAMLLVVASFVFFALWGAAAGLGAGNALLFFGFLVVCGFSASRIRTECGAPFTYFTPYYPYLIFFLFGGLFTFRLETMVLAFAAGGFMAVAQFLLFAPTQVEMLQLADTEKAKPRGVSWALLIGLLGGVTIGGYFMLVWAYGKGAESITYMKTWAVSQNWYFTSLRTAVANADAQVLHAAATGEEAGAVFPAGALTAVGIGGGITLLLTFLRTQFVGFWIHPIGYILANTFFIYAVWGSILAAWVIKWSALKIGGPRLIRERMTPFFVGVFVGSVAGMLFWDIVAAILMSRGTREVFTCLP
jgi:hypothetical protein